MSPKGWGERRFLRLPLRRSFCKACGTSFTLLPVFLAPGKWYDYNAIQNAMAFCGHSRFQSTNSAVTEWALCRIDREEGGLEPGPSGATVRRWWMQFQVQGAAPLHLTTTTLPQRQLPLSKHSDIEQQPSAHRRTATVFNEVLSLARSVSLLLSPLLGVWLWLFDGTRKRRTLFHSETAGRLIPCRSPSLEETLSPPQSYPPALPSPP